MSREALGSPEGEGDEVAVEPVFLTEEVLSRDPNLTPLSNRKDTEEWPPDKMIINIIEYGDDVPRTVRSPSPGSKTYIPQDILAEFHGDPYGRKEMHIAGQKMMGKANIVKEPQISTDQSGYIAPAWRPPRSRTPIQFSETPSRRAPKPLRQPPAESVPKSLTVHSLARRVLRRPKSTPPRISSPKDSRDLPVQQVLSDSSLASLTRDDMEAFSMVAQASSPSADTCGSIPPPPSPEALLVAPVIPSAPRLDPVSELEEKSSIASASVADGASQVEGGSNAVANLSEVEEGIEEVDLSQQIQNTKLGNKEEEEMVLKVTEEETETVETEQSKDAEESPNPHEQTVSLSVDGDSIIDKQNLPAIDTASDEITQDEGESEKQQDETPTETDESHDKEPVEEVTDPPHPPGSPDIVSTPDFTEGVDMSLDLEAELRAAMEGLDDLADEETGDKRTSPDLEAW